MKSLKHNLHFLKTFLLKPVHVGAVFPSSRFLAREMVQGLDLHAEQGLLELGPGTGAITRSIEKILPSPDNYLAIDKEASFIDVLHSRFEDMKFVCGDATDAVTICENQLKMPVHVVLSSLPFANFPQGLQLSIIEMLMNLLDEGGVFRTFQYVHSYMTPAAKRFRQNTSNVFGDFERSGVVWCNLPPAYVLTWRVQK